MHHQLHTAIVTVERCRKSWPVDDTGEAGQHYLDEAIEWLQRAVDEIRAEAFPPPKGLE
jgi:hypothetical protein